MAGLTAVALTAAMAPSVLLAAPAAAVSPNLVISQVYGAGGNTGATYTHDYVELFNRGTAAVSLAGMSIQYASATGTGNFGANSGQLTDLPNVTLQPGQYYLVQQAGGTTGAALPTPDLVDPTPIAMAAGAGKVALATGATTLGCNGGSAPCSADQLARVVDLVGYGNANFFEGPSAAPTLSATTAALRAGGGCTDTDSNAADFTSGPPAPRNTATTTNVCGVVTPDEPVINEFVANHVGTDTNEYVEVKGSPATDYSAYSVIQLEGDAGGAGVVDSVHPVGTTNSTGHWSTGFLTNALENGTLTLLLVEDFTGTVGADLDTNDDGALDVTPWSAIADSVAVTDGGAGDRTYSTIVLAPGFGGGTFTPGGASRIPDGTDTDTVADWTVNDFDLAGIPGFPGTPAEGEALNTPGAPNALVEVEPPPPAEALISEIQGSGPVSPLVDQVRTVEAVVTAVKPGLSGFHLQEEEADSDGDPATSEGVFVFGASTVGQVQVGQLVRVTGVVGEFTSTTGAGSSQTQLSQASVEVVAA
ncbi:MAG TPA: lamin tail domain-containing protein, partial [Jiangellales bacterium]|nr:lamin tail domain-containing protein [Jiangellales bacterium]